MNQVANTLYLTPSLLNFHKKYCLSQTEKTFSSCQKITIGLRACASQVTFLKGLVNKFDKMTGSICSHQMTLLATNCNSKYVIMQIKSIPYV